MQDGAGLATREYGITTAVQGYNLSETVDKQRIRMRLALYAHYSTSGGLGLHVLFHLRKLRDLGFRICFVSNSPIPQAREQELRETCENVIERDNSGYDFAM